MNIHRISEMAKKPALAEYFLNLENRKSVDKTISDIELNINAVERARYTPELKEEINYDLLIPLSTEMHNVLIEELQYLIQLCDTYDISNGNLKRLYLEEILDVDVITDGAPKTGNSEYFYMLKNALIEGRVYYIEHLIYRLENIMKQELNL